MSEMVKKVAKAMWNARVRRCAKLGLKLEAWGEGMLGEPAVKPEEEVALMNGILEEARAAIEAMRALTEPMRLAGNKWTGYHGPDSTDVWEEMIDAALNTNQETEA